MTEIPEFPITIAEFEGHTLTIELSDGKDPHKAPPGQLEVWVRRPDQDPEKPPAHLVDDAILRFSRTFAENEEITTTQAERHALREQVKAATQAERTLRKEIGQLKARVAELESETGKTRDEIRREMAGHQIRSLQTLLGGE